MKKLLSLLVLAACVTAAMAQGAPPQGGVDQPYTMEYYYKTQWGHQEEFLQLFLKNHYPLLRRIQDTGRILAIKIETPANHMTEESRWDYRVTITYKNSTVATTENPEEETILHQLYPDQEKYKREEQHRFEILLSHWDLPVTDITPGSRR
jgi:glucan phosphorylase